MQIIFEDYYLLVINKPAGLSSESGASRHPSAETEALLYFTKTLNESSTSKRLKATPYLRAVHRLDRASSGVLVFAKTKAALTHLMGQFERRETEKVYRAVLEKAPRPEAGSLTNFLKKSEDGRSAIITATQEAGTQPCELSYKTLNVNGKQVELEVRPSTGRFHQIRAQFAHIGCPIVGDVLYRAKPLKENEIKLHAEKLIIRHPKTEETLVLEAPLPEEWFQ
jgi:23S rRNA pseudouridine1911/1915/1917 synthase